MPTKPLLTYTALTIVVVLLGALAGWYLFLHSRTQDTQAIDAARGLSAPVPTYGGIGSTADNAGGFGPTPATPSTNGPTPQRLWQVDRAPVAGADFGANAGGFGSSTALYFVERANGYVFSTDPKSGALNRITDTLVPKIYEAIVVPGKASVIERGLDEHGAITTFVGSYTSTSSVSTSMHALSGTYLPSGIRRLIIDPQKTTLFLLSSDPASGQARGQIESWGTSKAGQVFASPLASWEAHFSSAGVVLVQSAADNTPGYAYVVNNKGVLTTLLGPALGLEVLPHPSEKGLLFSTSGGGVLSLFVEVGSTTPLRIALHTMAEKCVWAPGKSFIVYCAVPAQVSSVQFLNDWHQGTLHTHDTWWQIDAAVGSAEQLYAMPQALDVREPVIDDSGNYIAFQNASDRSLWAFRIAQ